MKTIFDLSNRQNTVLNLTHNDLDGAVSAIVVKNVYQNAITVKTNYPGTGDYIKGCEAIDVLEYDGIIFTDFCPDDNMVEHIHARGKLYYVIDHHQTAVDRPYSGYYHLDTSKCGAMLTLDFLSKIATLDHLRTLCEVTNDHDLWLRKIVPLSDNLNTLLYEYGYSEFIDKFMNGLEGYNLPKESAEILANHDKEVDEHMFRCNQHKLPYNGYYIETDRFNSDIVLRLLEHYDWLVLAGVEECSPGLTKLSFRTRRKDVNIGKFMKELGRGGGGHPGAAGQAIPTVEKDEFIGMVAENLFAPK